jgi:hypothetical protein
MQNQITIPENPIVVIGINEKKEKTFNKQKYSSLLQKKRYIESKFNGLSSEDPKDILSYSIYYPMKIGFNRKTQYKMKKDELNQIFIESAQKRFHKEIYNTKLFELISPYHLVCEKNYISSECLSEDIKNELDKDKDDILEREYALRPDEFYDKNNQIYFGFASKKDKIAKIKNKKLIKAAAEENCILVKVKNEGDMFNKIFLLNPKLKVIELKSLIVFIYKSVFKVSNPGKIKLFYYYDEINKLNENYLMDDNKTLKDIAKEMQKENNLEILINAYY